MKHIARRILIMLLLVSLLSGSSVLALDTPMVYMYDETENQTCAEGNILTFKFCVLPAFGTEKLNIIIYDSDGRLVVDHDVNLTNIADLSTGIYLSKDVSVTLDTKGYSGKYTIKYYMSFYTLYTWHDSIYVYTDEFTVVEPCPNNSHDWNDGEITTEPTCNEDGTKTYTCNDCGANRIETLLKGDHKYDIEFEMLAPSCTQAGEMQYVCSVCDEHMTAEIPATGHSYESSTVTKEPTCTEPGSKTFVCSTCFEEVSEEIPATGHSYDDFTVSKEPTCTEAGIKTSICNVCSEEVTQEIAPLDHSWDDGEVTQEATFSEEGEMTYTCEVCGETMTEEIPQKEECDGGKGCPSNKFKDVSKSAWYHEAVDYAVANSLFGGMSDKTFEPNTAMTRAMLVTVLWRYAGSPAEGKNEFKDVKRNQWYTDAVAWASENGIVGGVGGGKFAPNNNISREQMAAILYRYAQKSGIDTSNSTSLSKFPDSKSVSGYAKEAISWAVAEGLINGSDGKLLPGGNATRAQVAAILMRFIQNVVNA